MGDTREAPALKMITLLGALGADLAYHDPHVPSLDEHGLRSISLDDLLERSEVLVILTVHPSVDHDAALARAPLVVDLRGISRQHRPATTVVRL